MRETATAATPTTPNDAPGQPSTLHQPSDGGAGGCPLLRAFHSEDPPAVAYLLAAHAILESGRAGHADATDRAAGKPAGVSAVLHQHLASLQEQFTALASQPTPPSKRRPPPRRAEAVARHRWRACRLMCKDIPQHQLGGKLAATLSRCKLEAASTLQAWWRWTYLGREARGLGRCKCAVDYDGSSSRA